MFIDTKKSSQNYMSNIFSSFITKQILNILIDFFK